MWRSSISCLSLLTVRLSRFVFFFPLTLIPTLTSFLCVVATPNDCFSLNSDLNWITQFRTDGRISFEMIVIVFMIFMKFYPKQNTINFGGSDICLILTKPNLINLQNRVFNSSLRKHFWLIDLFLYVPLCDYANTSWQSFISFGLLQHVLSSFAKVVLHFTVSGDAHTIGFKNWTGRYRESPPVRRSESRDGRWGNFEDYLLHGYLICFEVRIITF